MTDILLSTLNARYIHASLGLRYLLANMGELQPRTRIIEFTLEPWPSDIAEALLAHDPKIIGFGVYIWNIEQTTRLVKLLKAIKPELCIVLGGPEISYEWQEQEIFNYADHIIPGQADLLFSELCQQVLDSNRPEKVYNAPPPPLNQITLPYACYSDEDIANRVLYVEASRGCPFKCEFCLSALDKTSWGFNLELFLAAMEQLFERGARHFKFVDRTFNLDNKTTLAILQFFLDRIDSGLFLHFEIIPDRLPEALKEILPRFPAGSLQFEIGIQSFNPEVQALISRKQNNTKTRENLIWLNNNTHAHIHADLIIGLPGESLKSFAEGFDQLVSLGTHEIQVGILKRLRGTPIIRHIDGFDMRYNPNPPYDILSNNQLTFSQLQQLNRFARYWDMIANSGRFKQTLPLLLGDSPYGRFAQLSHWLYQTTQQVHRIALKRLFDLLYEAMTDELAINPDDAKAALEQDFAQAKIKGLPQFLQAPQQSGQTETKQPGKHQSRQMRHLG
ncbi:MAG: DUF4080 domain-containing protein [Chromatiales bacterium]|nr:DUF4080 domain-containing protein [Chromatiales bacterium]